MEYRETLEGMRWEEKAHMKVYTTRSMPEGNKVGAGLIACYKQNKKRKHQNVGDEIEIFHAEPFAH